jgi:sec-independent protein translocase protein TatB
MFDIGWGEFLVIGIVALIAIGPKELPTVLRTVGQWMTKLRRMASEFQGQFQEAIREAEMADLKKEVDEMTEKAKGYAHFDPIGDIRKEIENISADKPAETPAADVASSPTVEPPTATATVEQPAAAAEQPAPDAAAGAQPTPEPLPAPEPVHDRTAHAGGKPA